MIFQICSSCRTSSGAREFNFSLVKYHLRQSLSKDYQLIQFNQDASLETPIHLNYTLSFICMPLAPALAASNHDNVSEPALPQFPVVVLIGLIEWTRHRASFRLIRPRLLCPVYQCLYVNSRCCPAEPSSCLQPVRRGFGVRKAETRERVVSDCMRVCVFGGIVLWPSGVVTEVPWRLSSEASRQVIHTGANAIMPTTNKHLVCVELDLLCDTRSEGLEVFKNRVQGFMNQIPMLII